MGDLVTVKGEEEEGALEGLVLSALVVERVVRVGNHTTCCLKRVTVKKSFLQVVLVRRVRMGMDGTRAVKGPVDLAEGEVVAGGEGVGSAARVEKEDLVSVVLLFFISLSWLSLAVV